MQPVDLVKDRTLCHGLDNSLAVLQIERDGTFVKIDFDLAGGGEVVASVVILLAQWLQDLRTHSRVTTAASLGIESDLMLILQSLASL
jgi:hypothetical protein